MTDEEKIEQAMAALDPCGWPVLLTHADREVLGERIPRSMPRCALPASHEGRCAYVVGTKAYVSREAAVLPEYRRLGGWRKILAGITK